MKHATRAFMSTPPTPSNGCMASRTRRALAALCLGALALAAQGADRITAFEPGKVPEEKLKQVPVKAVVAEFLDPDDTNLGRELAALMWREILFAISDQSGAGVIVARAPDNVRLTELLRKNYHEAALEIAQSQRARMAVWGAVGADREQVFVDTYLSLVGDVPREELALRVRWQEGDRSVDSGFAARLSRTRFNFPRVVTTRAALFERALVARKGAPIRAGAGTGATLRTAGEQEPLAALDMQNDWFRVRLPDGRTGWVDSSWVDVPPPWVQLAQPGVVRSAPSAKAAALGQAPAGRARVLASQYVSGEGLWYRVRVGGYAGNLEGWLSAQNATPRFSFPAVHFIGGLYRYQLGRYADAARYFDQYTRTDSASNDPPSLSSAYQLLAASRLAAKKNGVDDWMAPLDRAAKITPYDPAIYVLRAVSLIGVSNRFSPAQPDLRKTLELDPDNVDAKRLIARALLLIEKAEPLMPYELGQDLRGPSGAGTWVKELGNKYR